MLRIFADNPDDAFALNDFALLAHRLYGRSYFHDAHSFPRFITLKTTRPKAESFSSLPPENTLVNTYFEKSIRPLMYITPGPPFGCKLRSSRH